jgi:tetratricopeptide (TPR) repeat protein
MTRTILCAAFAFAVGIAAVPALAVDNMDSDVDLTSVRTKIKVKDYPAALKELRELVEDSQSPDVYNLLGFTLRKTGDYTTSLTYYTKALELDPTHKAAREYLGELFLETGKMDQAREQLAALVRLCPGGCEEREDLQQAIAAKAGK